MMLSSVTLRSPALAEGGDVRVVRFREQQRFARGGLARAAKSREVMLHITPQEFDLLRHAWGEPRSGEYQFAPGSLRQVVQRFANGGAVGYAPTSQPLQTTQAQDGRRFVPLERQEDYYTYGERPEHSFFSGNITPPPPATFATPTTPTQGVGTQSAGGKWGLGEVGGALAGAAKLAQALGYSNAWTQGAGTLGNLASGNYLGAAKDAMNLYGTLAGPSLSSLGSGAAANAAVQSALGSGVAPLGTTASGVMTGLPAASTLAGSMGSIGSGAALNAAALEALGGTAGAAGAGTAGAAAGAGAAGAGAAGAAGAGAAGAGAAGAGGAGTAGAGGAGAAGSPLASMGAYAIPAMAVITAGLALKAGTQGRTGGQVFADDQSSLLAAVNSGAIKQRNVVGPGGTWDGTREYVLPDGSVTQNMQDAIKAAHAWNEATDWKALGELNYNPYAGSMSDPGKASLGGEWSGNYRIAPDDPELVKRAAAEQASAYNAGLQSLMQSGADPAAVLASFGQGMARGGALRLAGSEFRTGSGPTPTNHVKGPGTGRSDSIPAQLSDGEYVLTAEDVSLLGDGSNEAGAKRLDEFRRALREHKGRALARGQLSPDAKSPMEYLRGAR